MYGLVKHICDQKFSIVSQVCTPCVSLSQLTLFLSPTQCFNVDKMLNLPGGYFDNFLLKVNGKFGGLNAVVDPNLVKQLPFDTSKTMFVGVDVNHPSETERIASSVACAVGSMDPMFSNYVASI